MGIITDLTSGIESTMATTLGAAYSKLPYVNDITKNNFNANNNRYGVLVGSSSQSDTVTKHVTMSQSFTMVITKAYIDDGVSDTDSQSKQQEIQDLVLDVFKDLYNTKAGVPLIFLNITDLSVGEPEIVNESEFLAIRASFNILYRFSL